MGGMTAAAGSPLDSGRRCWLSGKRRWNERGNANARSRIESLAHDDSKIQAYPSKEQAAEMLSNVKRSW